MVARTPTFISTAKVDGCHPSSIRPLFKYDIPNTIHITINDVTLLSPRHHITRTIHGFPHKPLDVQNEKIVHGTAIYDKKGILNLCPS